jgi:hypothetical protein
MGNNISCNLPKRNLNSKGFNQRRGGRGRLQTKTEQSLRNKKMWGTQPDPSLLSSIIKICKKLINYLWTYYKLPSTIILTGLILIFLCNWTLYDFLMGTFLFATLYNNILRGTEEDDDEIDDFILFLNIINELKKNYNGNDD